MCDRTKLFIEGIGLLHFLFKIFGSYKKILYICHQSGKDPLQQKKRNALNLRNENLGNFHPTKIARGQNGFHA